MAEEQPSGLDAEVICSRAGVDAFVAEWRTFLEGVAGDHTVFQTPEAFRERLASSTAYSPFVIVIRSSQGQIECVAPGLIHETTMSLWLSLVRCGRFRARILRLIGDSCVFTNAADQPSCMAAVARAWARHRKRFSFVQVESLPVGGALWSWFAGGRRTRCGLRLRRFAPQFDKVRRLRFDRSHDAYLQAMSSATRNALKRREKKLRAAFDGNVSVQCIRTPEQVRPFLAAVQRISNGTWQARTFGAVEYDSEQNISAMMQMAGKGWLRSYLLTGGDIPLAFVIGYQYGGQFVFAEPGFDRAWEALAPGTVLNSLLIGDLFNHSTPRVLDFGFGDNQYKRILGNECADACKAAIVHSPAWRALIFVQRAVAGVEQCVRATLKSLRLDQPVRRMLRHNGLFQGAAQDVWRGLGVTVLGHLGALNASVRRPVFVRPLAALVVCLIRIRFSGGQRL